MENVEKTLEIKQSEYNFLLENKDQEIKFMADEILKLNETVDSIKRDRIRDQKILNDYESEINFLSSRVEDNNKVSESIQKDENLAIKQQVQVRIKVFTEKLEKTYSCQSGSYQNRKKT